jgi:membrane protease YdiL (CAAX protease family)
MSNAPQEAIPAPPPTDNYWRESREPLTSLAFIAPLLVVYEAGVLLPSGDSARNGVDVWLRAILDGIGFGQYFLLPASTVGILLAWHYTTRRPWRVSRRVLGRMAVECLLLAACLVALNQLLGMVFQSLVAPGPTAVACAVEPPAAPAFSERLGNLLMFLGAGIYEELLFRLVLLSAAIGVLRRLGATARWSIAYAAAITSLIFAAAHYVGPHGEAFGLFSFACRFVAGVFFCALFVYRGFGVAAGTHAVYDILVGLLPQG